MSLLVATTSLGLAGYNTWIQDTDKLAVDCQEDFTGHVGVEWPSTYPVPSNVKAELLPVLLVRCDLTNAGRRTLSVVRFALGATASKVSLWGAGPEPKQVAPLYYGEPDSSVLGLPLTITSGESRRLAVLLGVKVDSAGYESFYLIPRSGHPALLAVQPPTDTSSWAALSDSIANGQSVDGKLPVGRSVRWEFRFRFTTALGQVAEYATAIFGLSHEAKSRKTDGGRGGSPE